MAQSLPLAVQQLRLATEAASECSVPVSVYRGVRTSFLSLLDLIACESRCECSA
jgi:hypothetical protein